MTRKNLLEGLMGSAKPTTPNPQPSSTPRYAKGAIGAISRSVADLQSRALTEIDPFLIDAGGMHDRLETDSVEDEGLRDSIREYGQQVPVLVRPHPTEAGRYQIVYGRRRVLALRDLGLPVKALVRHLDDRDLVIAQGQENTARRDLSFIEKANFARQMQEAGYDRKIIGDTLSMDKTLISRLLSVADRIPTQLIEAIGAAPSIGRDRWLALADAIQAGEHETSEMVAMVNLATANSSDARFEAALAYAKGPKTARKGQNSLTVINSVHGTPIAEAKRSAGRMTIKLMKSRDPGFEDWLLAELPELHRRWNENK